MRAIIPLLFVACGSTALLAEGCDLSKPLDICFGQQPIAYNRCNKSVRADFKVYSADPDRKYSLTWRWFLNNKELELPEDQRRSPGGFSLVGPDPKIEVGVSARAGGPYSIEMTASDANGITVTRRSSLEPIDVRPKVLAILIGLSSYANSTESPLGAAGIQNLRFAHSDANAMELFLKEVVSEKLLTVIKFTSCPSCPNSGTADDIKHALRKAQDQEEYCTDDSFLFYYSGHAFVDEGGHHYVGTYKADPTNLTTLRDTTIAVPELMYQLSLIDKGVSKIVIFDSCFSGGDFAFNSSDPGKANRVGERGSLTFGKSSKVQLVGKKGRITDWTGIPSSESTWSAEDQSRKSAQPMLFISAVGANVEAQEAFFCKEPGTRPGETRAICLSDVKGYESATAGHGLFTYFLLKALAGKMANNHNHRDFIGDGVNSFNNSLSNCEIDIVKIEHTEHVLYQEYADQYMGHQEVGSVQNIHGPFQPLGCKLNTSTMQGPP